MSTATATVEFVVLTEKQLKELSPGELNEYTSALLEHKGLSWSGRTPDKEDPLQFHNVESHLCQTNYDRNRNRNVS